jgi:pilus assembly protein Flp/PilA
MSGTTMRAAVARWLRGEGGATAVEYGLILALVSIAAIIALQQLGVSLLGIYESINRALENIASKLQ